MPISSKELTAKHMKQKSAHSLGQNTAYMLSLAWRRRRSVIWLSLTTVTAAILLGLTQLFIVPSILSAVETKASVAELTVIIFMFTAALMAIAFNGFAGLI